MSESRAHDPERRRYTRVKAKIPVELTCPGTPPMRTVTDEISLCGCYIETMFTMDVGTKVNLVFSLQESKVTAMGIVATKYPQVGNGIDFIDMDPDCRLKVRQFIREREAETQD
jgi:c-di-GMP-binding flagellar brake protein YcgR